MFANLKKSLTAKIFPCHKALITVFQDNADSVINQTAARERLQAVCQQGIACYNSELKSQR